MKVSGIFKTLVVVVICVIVGAMAINIFMPNLVSQLSNTIENSIYQATGMGFDFNGDGVKGNTTSIGATKNGKNDKSSTTNTGSTVGGFSGAVAQ